MLTVSSEGESSDKSKLTSYQVGLFEQKPDKPLIVNQSPISVSKQVDTSSQFYQSQLHSNRLWHRQRNNPDFATLSQNSRTSHYFAATGETAKSLKSRQQMQETMRYTKRAFADLALRYPKKERYRPQSPAPPVMQPLTTEELVRMKDETDRILKLNTVLKQIKLTGKQEARFVSKQNDAWQKFNEFWSAKQQHRSLVMEQIQLRLDEAKQIEMAVKTRKGMRSIPIPEVKVATPSEKDLVVQSEHSPNRETILNPSPTIITRRDTVNNKQKLTELKQKFAVKSRPSPLLVSDGSVLRIMANETAAYEDDVDQIVMQQLEQSRKNFLIIKKKRF